MNKDHNVSNKWRDLAEAAEQDDFDEDLDEAQAAPAEPEKPSSEQGSLSFEDLKTQIQKEEARANEYLERSIRLQADIENMRRRFEREKADAHNFGLNKFANALLPVIDNLERGLQAADTNPTQEARVLREGVEMTLKLFQDVLVRFGIQPVDPLGQPFDSAHHEAVSIAESDAAAGTVLSVFQKGYLLNGRLLRPAMVVVAKQKV